MKKSAFQLMVVAAVVTFAAAAGATVPHFINYQGTITGPSGPTNGTYNMSFALYADSTGGLPLWTESHTGVPITYGLFNVILGRFAALPDDLFSSTPRWMGTTIGADPEIAPRMRMTAVPWAMRAAVAESSLVSAPDEDWSFSGSNIYRLTGNVGVGTSTPAHLLDVRSDAADAYVNVSGRSDGLSGIMLARGAAYLRYDEAAPEVRLWNAVTGGNAGDIALGTNNLERLRIKRDGQVGIGVTAPTDLLEVAGTVKMTGFKMPSGATDGYVLTSDASGIGTWQVAPAMTDDDWTIIGSNMYSTVAGNVGIGITTPASKLYVKATTGTSLVAISNDGVGVYGKDESTGSYGYLGYDTVGVYGFTDEPTKPAVFGYGGGLNGYGVKGVHGTTKNFGLLGHETAGVFGRCFDAAHDGVRGYYGSNIGSLGTGIGGVKGYSPSGYGVHGESPSGYAGYFTGDVHVTGTLTKAHGSFVIDHPLDPANKILRHMFVESPENLCVYRGKIALDAAGEAVVTLPSYFAALTKEENATVTLTSIGKPFLTGYEWLPGRSTFRVYGEAGREISWVAFADRDDRAARTLTRPVEEEKGPENKLCARGTLLNP